jgi:hypothetical protein
MSRGRLRPIKHLTISALAVAILLTGCGTPVERDVGAYRACISRHRQEAALCEGPRQAYEIDTATPRATASALNPPVGM